MRKWKFTIPRQDFPHHYLKNLDIVFGMKRGITNTENGDLIYVGPKRNSQDVTDAVMAWLDNDS